MWEMEESQSNKKKNEPDKYKGLLKSSLHNKIGILTKFE